MLLIGFAGMWLQARQRSAPGRLRPWRSFRLPMRRVRERARWLIAAPLAADWRAAAVQGYRPRFGSLPQARHGRASANLNFSNPTLPDVRGAWRPATSTQAGPVALSLPQRRRVARRAAVEPAPFAALRKPASRRASTRWDGSAAAAAFRRGRRESSLWPEDVRGRVARDIVSDY